MWSIRSLGESHGGYDPAQLSAALFIDLAVRLTDWASQSGLARGERT